MGDRDRELLKKLAIDEPWSLSTEGLDDCCMFCGSYKRDWKADGIYLHEADCVWLESREYLRMKQPKHTRKP